MRNCFKRNHDDKLAELLGMRYSTAAKQLERKLILHLAKKCGMGNCHQCGFPIENAEDMTIEHKTSWAGNKGKELLSDASLFWDMDNIAFSHLVCNISAASGGTGKFGITGVNYVLDKRRDPPKEYARGAICIDNCPMTLGYYKTPQEAGVAYDIVCFIARDGVCKLNFEYLREEYANIIQNSPLFGARTDKIKQMYEDRSLLKVLKHIVLNLRDKVKND